MSNVLFRVDANQELGWGHLQRCIGIAKALEKKNIKSIFLIKHYSKITLDYLKNRDIAYNLIPNFKKSEIKEELSFIIKLIEKLDIKTSFIDISHSIYVKNEAYYINYINSLNKLLFTVLFSDFNKFNFKTDILIVPYICAKYYYKELENNLLGENYFVLRKEFSEKKQDYIVKETVSNVLITMGGSNPCESIETAVESLILSKYKGSCKVIVGKEANINFDRIKKLISESQIEFSLVFNNADFIDLLYSSDLVYTNSGLTKYETMFLGIPTFTFSINEDHFNLMNLFTQETGCIFHVGNLNKLSSIEISNDLNNFINNYSKRKAFSEKSKKIIDGKGIQRILKKVIIK